MVKNRNAVHSLNPHMRKILHSVSVVASFFLMWSVLVILLTLTIGMLPGIWDIHIGYLPIVAVVLSIISALLVLKFVRFDSPYQ